jgi:serine/threonine protein kinase
MEIQRYPVVYCVGSHAKKHWATTDQSSCNYGYDDEKGDYQIVIRDHLNYRYEMIESLGKGSFGQVIKCRDLKLNPENNNLVAVKIIRNKKRFHAQAQTEVKILEQLMKWVNNNNIHCIRFLFFFT